MKIRSKWLGLVLFTMVLIGGVVGCDSGGDGKDKDSNPGDPKSITGDAVLRVTVKDDITNIYFDGDYIGTLAPNETQNYNVPTGEHVVRFTNAEHDNQDPDSITVDFKEGVIHPVTVSWEKEDNSIF